MGWLPLGGGGGGGGENGSYSETIGDNSATSFQVNHDLDSTDVVVQLWDLTGSDPVLATGDASSIEVDDANNVTVTFSVAPASDAYRVVVLVAGSSSGGGATDFRDYTEQSSTPSSPSTGVLRVYAIDGDLFLLDEDGTKLRLVTEFVSPIEFVAVETAEENAANSLTIDLPAAAQSGDIALFHSSSANSVPNANGPGGDSSWTLLWRTDISSNEYITCWAKVLGGSEPSDYTLTFSSSNQLGAVSVWRGASAVRGSAVTTGTFTTPSTVDVQVADLVVPIWHQIAGSGPTTTIGGGQGLTSAFKVQQSTGDIKEVVVAYAAAQESTLRAYLASGGSSALARGCGVVVLQPS